MTNHTTTIKPSESNTMFELHCSTCGLITRDFSHWSLSRMAESHEERDDARDRHKTGSPVPTSDEHERTCMHYRSFGDRPCDCGTDTGRGEA